MSRRNVICITPEKAIHVEGIIAAAITPKPGQVVQVDPSVALQDGRHTWKLYDADADGGNPKGPLIILTEDSLQGRLMTTAYAAGERAFGVIPLPGCELNLLFGDIAGTGATSDVTAGNVLIPNDTDGKWLVTTGSPEIEPAMALETVADMTEDTLIWCQWTGY